MSDYEQAHTEMFVVNQANISEQDNKQLLVYRQNMIDSQNQNSAVVKFLLELKEINLYIAIQSVLDSLDIWLSAIKYYFDAVNPASGNKSSASMYEWLKTPEGLIFFIVGGLFFGVFAFLGNTYNAKKKDKNTLPAFSKMADENWPFVRDCFKGLKWTFKGTRSVFVVLQILFQQSYVSFITPFGIGFGVLAAANRYWNRKMIENRKLLQAENDSFRDNIKYINTCFLEVDAKWVNQFQYLEPKHQKLYQGCILKLKSASSGLQQFYYVDEKRIEDKVSFELKSLYTHQQFDEQIQIEKGTQQSFEINVSQFEQLSQLSVDERKKYAMCMFILNEKVFFIDEQGRMVFAQNEQNYNISDAQFPGLFHQHGIDFSESEIYRVDHQTGKRHKVASDFPELGHNKKAFLEHLEHLVQQYPDQHTNQCYVFDKQLFYVTSEGWIARYSRSTRSFIFPPSYYSAPLSLVEMQFLLKRQEEGEDKLDIFHYDYLLNQKISESSSEKKSSQEISKLKLGQILAEKKNYLKTLSNDKAAFTALYHTPKFQDDYVFAYVSAGLNGILNAPYYFLGLLTMVTIPTSFFLPAVGLCSFFMVLNFIAEMYQEFDYQRRLSITEFKAKLSMIKRFISLEWDHINVRIQGVDTALYEKVWGEPTEPNTSPATIPSMSPHFELKYNLKMMQIFLTQEEFDSILTPESTSDQKEIFNLLLAEAFKRLEEFQDDFSVNDIESLTKQQVAFAFRSKFGQELDEKSFIFSHLKLKQYLNDYNEYQDKLKEKMILPQFPVIMQGIKNGLHCYGVFNGFLMTLASLAFLYGWTFGPQLFALSIGVGFSCVIFGTLYTALFSNLESKPVAADEAEGEISAQAVQVKAGSPCGFIVEDKTVPYWYNKKVYGKIISNDNDIQPSKNLLISEQFEVLRQFLSGFKKGIKFLQTIFMLVPAGMPDSNIFVRTLYCVVSLIYGCFFALKGLRGLIRQDPKDYENSVLLSPIFSKDKTEPVALLESPRVVYDNSKFINSALATPLSRGVSPYSSFPSNMNLFAMGQSVDTIEENEPSLGSTP
jgi:hypothetical protein